MSLRKISLVLVLTLLGVTLNGQSKDDELLSLLKLIGVKENLVLMVDQTLDYMKKERPNISTDDWNQVRNGLEYDSLLMKLVPVYSKHYKHSEVKELIDFFESPIGRKYVAKGGVIGQESYIAGKSIGKSIAEAIYVRLRILGY